MKNLNYITLINGLFACLDNAEALIKESEILYEHSSYARAFALSQLAIEEIGKTGILFTLYTKLKDKYSEIDYKKIENDFRDHKVKTFSSTLADFMSLASKRLSKEEEEKQIHLILKEIEKTKGDYNVLKNDSLYVNYKNKQFVSPQSAISKELATTTITKAKERHEQFYKDVKRTVDLDIDTHSFDENGQYRGPKLTSTNLIL